MSTTIFKSDLFWESLGDGLERTKVEGGWIYRNIPTGSICFVPAMAQAAALPSFATAAVGRIGGAS